MFEDVTVHVRPRMRAALVGKNGAGKSTIMRLITGEQDMKAGERWVEPGVTIGYMEQEPTFSADMTVEEYVREGLADMEDPEGNEYLIDIVLGPLGVNRKDKLAKMSGGQVRRSSLAKALIANPDILLLDEPTNHLDLDIIEWLEDYLKSYQGSVVCISHDRAFLRNVTSSIIWVDRGVVRTHNKGYATFDDWSLEILEHEQRRLQNLEKRAQMEGAWASGGIRARRKRNQRRLQEFYKVRDKLRADKARFRETLNKIRLGEIESSQASKLLAEFKGVTKSFIKQDGEEFFVAKDLSMRIMRKERIGIIGRNGTGKTSFLKLLTKELTPDEGRIRLGKTLELRYFDQKRSMLEPKKTLWETLVPEGGDRVNVGGKSMHVIAYLKQFMFEPGQAHDKVSTLSGGQANRLLLARILADPGNFLILDEPTNDLDMDTLDMLQEVLADFDGALVIVSHDRDFLDRSVHSILAFEGEGRVEKYWGGYTDYLETVAAEAAKKTAKPAEETTKQGADKPTGKKKPAKISYKVKYEYEQLPEKIKTLEQEVTDLEAHLSNPDLFNDDPDKFAHVTARLPDARLDLANAEIRWLELDEMLG